MATEDSRPFDILIFGASGYTGKYVIEELAKAVKGTDLKWAVAGRSSEKLKKSLSDVQEYLGETTDIKEIDIIIADINDKDSISEMCKKTRLILNCVGPYKFYGEIVVTACIQNGTHHVDLSGEMKYLEEMQIKYFDQAKEKGVYIVQACGFDSIPSDLGIALLKKEFPGDVNSVEAYVSFIDGSEGKVVNIGTWLSAVHSVIDVLSEKARMKQLKEKIFTKELPKSKYPPTSRLPLFYSDIAKGWCFRFVGPDEAVVRRTQMFNYQFLNERPIKMKAYLNVRTFSAALAYLFFMAVFGVMSMFSFGRYLLGKFPGLFSAGTFSKDGPTRRQVEQSSTKMTLVANGWNEKLAEPTDQHEQKPDKTMELSITGPDAAYVLTSICMVEAGLVILKESDKIPISGGILTPGAAFAKTSLIDRLQKQRITFNIVKK